MKLSSRTALVIKRICLILTAASLACACGSTPQRTANMTSERGPAPTQEQAQAFILNALTQHLKDPDSLKQFRIRSGPTPVSWYKGLLFGGGYDSAWLFCFEYNAKNSYGAYTGVKVDGLALRLSSDGQTAYNVPSDNLVTADAHC